MRLLIVSVFALFFFSCSPYTFKDMPTSTHTYKLTVKDVNGNPLEGVGVHLKVNEGAEHKPLKDTSVISLSTGIIVYNVRVVPDPRFTDEPHYSSEIEYEVSKEGYYKRSGTLTMFLDHSDKNLKYDDITLIRPTDYINPVFLSSIKDEVITSKILGFLDVLLIRSLLSESYLETHSINLGTFKEHTYLSFKFINSNTYNSLKLSKYDIAKTLFDEVIRKVLNPLNDNLGDSKEFYGYDLTVIGHTKSFLDKYANSQSISYRFLIPTEIVKKYKSKDISGQQVLDSSIILMDDERIDLKLQ
jgi:hypothetical protein